MPQSTVLKSLYRQAYMLNGRQCKLRPAEMMTTLVTNFVTGAVQEINPWWYVMTIIMINELLC